MDRKVIHQKYNSDLCIKRAFKEKMKAVFSRTATPTALVIIILNLKGHSLVLNMNAESLLIKDMPYVIQHNSVYTCYISSP